jgi:hypothetical protein
VKLFVVELDCGCGLTGGGDEVGLGLLVRLLLVIVRGWGWMEAFELLMDIAVLNN